MDISVSRLNNRMALQVPGELPLGLVFIVGRVENLGAPAKDSVQFELVDAGYRLRCHLPNAVAEETLLKEKDRVRASGHLTFDSHSAQYQLLARDIEVLAARPTGEETSRAPATAVQRPAGEGSLAPTKLPPWVRKLAPPEVKEELDLEQEGEEPEQASETDVLEERVLAAGDLPTELPPEMVAFLSNAIDSDEEIELTPEMIAEYLPPPTQAAKRVPEAEEAAATAEEGPALMAEDAAGTAVEEADEEQMAVEPVVDAGRSDVIREPAGGGDRSLPDHFADAPESEEAMTSRPAVLSPPLGPPRRERQAQPQSEPQPRPMRQYLEYAAIVLLVILIMAALFLILLLLQT